MLIVKSLRFAVFLRGYGRLDWVVVVLFTLTFDSSPIKGEGDDGCFGLVHPVSPCGYWLEASMTATRP